jgi:hypothetical protein
MSKAKEKINGALLKLENERRKALTRILMDSGRLKALRACAKQKARETVMEFECLTEEELDEETTRHDPGVEAS